MPHRAQHRFHHHLITVLSKSGRLSRAASSIQTKHRRWIAFPRLIQYLNWLFWEPAQSQQLSVGAARYGLQNQAVTHHSVLGPPLESQLCHCPTQVATIFFFLIQGRGSSSDPGIHDT